MQTRLACVLRRVLRKSSPQLPASPSFSYETEDGKLNQTNTQNREQADRQTNESAPLLGIPHPAHHARLVGRPEEAFQEKLHKHARKKLTKVSPLLLSLEQEDRGDLAVCLTNNTQEGPSADAPEVPWLPSGPRPFPDHCPWFALLRGRHTSQDPIP